MQTAGSPAISSRLHELLIDGIRLEVYDHATSVAAHIIARELAKDQYGLRGINFAPGDIVVDVGGHIGIFAMYLASLAPEVRIHSFEPFPLNLYNFGRNLLLNRISNVHLHPLAVTGDGRPVAMTTNPANSGGATAKSRTLTFYPFSDIPSITLDAIFEQLAISRCKLLKLDCEGSEYEILRRSTVLPRVDYLSMECHTNRLLTEEESIPAALGDYCAQFVEPRNLKIHACPMSE